MYLPGKPLEAMEPVYARMQQLLKGLFEGFPLDQDPIQLENIEDLYQFLVLMKATLLAYLADSTCLAQPFALMNSLKFRSLIAIHSYATYTVINAASITGAIF